MLSGPTFPIRWPIRTTRIGGFSGTTHLIISLRSRANTGGCHPIFQLKNCSRLNGNNLLLRIFTFWGKLMDWIVNRSEFTAYLYEAKFSWFIPCFEIYVCLSKRTKEN